MISPIFGRFLEVFVHFYQCLFGANGSILPIVKKRTKNIKNTQIVRIFELEAKKETTNALNNQKSTLINNKYQ